jgi:DNA-binding NarL/FixJ family response regulator
MTHRVYIVEDHDSLRQLLASYIDSLPDLVVCGAASSGEQALADLVDEPADLLVVDLSLPRMSGTEVVRAARSRWPDMRCIILSAHMGLDVVERALAAGAQGYVRKGDPEDLHAAIRCVLEGRVYTGEAVPQLGADDGPAGERHS